MKEIEEIAKETGRDFSAIVKDLLAEAIKMRRCPGIVFARGPVAEGRESRAPESRYGRSSPPIEAWRGSEETQDRLSLAFPGATRAALGYYAAYPQEIERQIEQNERWTESKIRERHPLMSSHSRSR